MENVEGQDTDVVEQQQEQQVDVNELVAKLEKLESTNARLLEESKTYKNRYESTQKEKEESERARLEEEGKIQELLDLEKSTSLQLKDQLQTLKKETLRKSLNFEAAKYAGDAYDVDDIIKSLPTDVIKMDEDALTFEGVQDAVTKLRETKPYLFKSEINTGMVDGRPTSGVPQEKTYAEMSEQEKDASLIEALKQL